MESIYNGRTYAVIPIEKVNFHVKASIAYGRLSNDKKFIIWDQAWKPESKNSLKADSAVQLLSHKEALALMDTPAWQRKDPAEELKN